MGGNLYKKPRISKNSYFIILKELTNIFDTILGEDNYFVPKAYYNKPDYGDMDVLVNKEILDTAPDCINQIIKTLDIDQVKRSNNLVSILYNDFQVDFFLVKNKHYDSMCNFMNYNILGNLIGRIYHKFGLKYGERGLTYVLRSSDNHIKKEVIISKDMKEILEFIELDYNKWLSGFDNLEDIFYYIVNSKYFTIKSYDPKYFTINKRKKERKDFNTFLNWLEINNITKSYDFPLCKTPWLQKIDDYFECDIINIKMVHEQIDKKNNLTKKKFNGHVVLKLLPQLEGSNLGSFIHYMKHTYIPDILKTNIHSWTENSSEEKINEEIMTAYHEHFIPKTLLR